MLSESSISSTTIISSSLVAVVLVFTVCQIPQAISLTLQSFFPTLAQTPKVLIYNNFANGLVALNASTNFFLYCCFSERFRSTFRSNFSFLSKYCAHYIQPKWKIKESSHHTKHSTSMENISTYSSHPHQFNTRLSNSSMDLNSKYPSPMNQKFFGSKQPWLNGLPASFAKPLLVRSATTYNVTIDADRTLKLSNNESISKLPATTEQLLNRRNSCSGQEIMDVPV